tara:strand:+ start:421 stop:630 length:210 start_codon:yes stop_codon:yes gene_type:complete
VSQLDDVMICEGAMQPPGETYEQRREATLAAWQRLIDSGMAWKLQGFFGRTAANLIDQGLCKRPEDKTP